MARRKTLKTFVPIIYIQEFDLRVAGHWSGSYIRNRYTENTNECGMRDERGWG
jgi:hypothetical protein